MKAGAASIVGGGILKVVLFIFLSPILGMLGTLLLSLVVLWLARRSAPDRVDKTFRLGNFVIGGIQSRPRNQRRTKDDGDY